MYNHRRVKLSINMVLGSYLLFFLFSRSVKFKTTFCFYTPIPVRYLYDFNKKRQKHATSNEPEKNSTVGGGTKEVLRTPQKIKILDTSKGDIINYKDLMTINRIKCLDCGYLYEGKEILQTCPKCGSSKVECRDDFEVPT